jgi:hypothetical protein
VKSGVPAPETGLSHPTRESAILENGRGVCYVTELGFAANSGVASSRLYVEPESESFAVTAVLMSNVKSQAISGVSAGSEAEIMTAYPSVAATGAGQSIGRLCDAVPLKTNGIPWPRLLVGILFWPIVVPFALTVGLLLYSYMKLLGKRYVLTNRSLEVRQMIGVRNYAHANLTDIKQVVIRELPGQAFYKAADLIGTGADGKTIIRLEGVQRPAVFRQTILEARDAKSQIEDSLKAIQARAK